MKLKILNIYIETNLVNSFIKFLKILINILVL